MDHEFGDLGIQEIVDLATEAKNNFGTYDGYAPRQCFSCREHPLLQSKAAIPDLAPGTAFEEHLQRRVAAAAHFHAADARNLLRMALLARSRRLREPQQGQIVYYFRRKRGKRPEYRGPARVIVVEPLETGLPAGVSVV